MRNLSTIQRVLLAGLGLVVAALACSAPSMQAGTAPTTEVAQVAPGEAITATPYVVTATLGPGATEVATEPPAAATTAALTSESSCADSLYIADLTIPDGTSIQTGVAFTKTWRVKNNGCSAWPDGTKLVYLSGDQMSGPAGVDVPQTAVGGTQDISLNLTAPGAAGDYTGKWRMRTPDGVMFGDTLSIIITTTAPAPEAKPTLHLVIPPGGFQLLTAKFTASFAGAKKPCVTPFGSAYWVKVTNTGTLKFESSYLALELPTGSQISDRSDNAGFLGANNCSASASSSLDAGANAWLIIGGGPKSFLPGTNGKITVKLCGLDDQGGACVTHSVTFTIS